MNTITDRFQFAALLHVWVTGYFFKYAVDSGVYSKSDLGGPEFNAYMAATERKVWGYINGTQTLDGTCSDMQCCAALEAARLFKPTLDAIKAADKVRDQERDLAHESDMRSLRRAQLQADY